MANTQLQLQTGFIDRIADNDVIPQRITDGYVNATAMCKSCGKEWSNYAKAVNTIAFIDELSSVLQIGRTGLIQSIQGGTPALQGTWVHPQIAIHLGQWLSPKFAVVVSQWVSEWMSGKISGKLPYHLQRYLVNMPNVPYGYFSMLNEVTLALIGPLEQMGYTVSSSMIPDISLGKTFSQHLRSLGYPVDEYPKYPHQFEDGRVVEARAYPNALLGVLRKFFVETWMRERSIQYFEQRDPQALPYLRRFMSLPNYREAMGYIEVPS